MLVEFSEEARKNLMLFLDRVPIKGHQERHAMNEIERIMSEPKEKKEE